MSKKQANNDNDIDEGFDDDFDDFEGTQSFRKDTQSRSKVLAGLEQQRRLLQEAEKQKTKTQKNTKAEKNRLQQIETLQNRIRDLESKLKKPKRVLPKTIAIEKKQEEKVKEKKQQGVREQKIGLKDSLNAKAMNDEQKSAMKKLYFDDMYYFGRDKLYKKINETKPELKISRRMVMRWLAEQELSQ